MKDTLEYLLSLTPIGVKEDNITEIRTKVFDFSTNSIGFDGVVCEFGVRSGTTARIIIDRVSAETPVYLFDSFNGIPEDWCPDSPRGSFPTDIKPVFNENNVTIIEGLFEDTLKDFRPTKDISFIHIDCDLYSSTLTALTMCNEFIREGTVIQFDELYNYTRYEKHEYKALNEWSRVFKRSFEYVYRSTQTQAVIRVLA